MCKINSLEQEIVIVEHKFLSESLKEKVIKMKNDLNELKPLHEKYSISFFQNTYVLSKPYWSIKCKLIGEKHKLELYRKTNAEGT